MKTLIINGSPNKSKGITSYFSAPFVKGLIEAGAIVETLYTSEIKIAPCSGKLICWKREDHSCYHRDYMKYVINKIEEADLLIFATPIHSDGVTGTLKNLFDRLLPLKEAIFTEKNGRDRHVGRITSKMPYLLLISTCGFYEIENFIPILNHIRALCDNYNFKYSGSLLRPHSLLYRILDNQKTEDIRDALFSEGLNFIKFNFISHENHMRILQNITSKEEYFYLVNDYFENIRGQKRYNSKTELSI